MGTGGTQRPAHRRKPALGLASFHRGVSMPDPISAEPLEAPARKELDRRAGSPQFCNGRRRAVNDANTQDELLQRFCLLFLIISGWPNNWVLPMPRTTNEAGLALIKHFEGCRLNAYQDVAGIWTIGYGHIHGVSAGMTFTQDQADQALSNDLISIARDVENSLAGANTTDNQLAAMIALAFNIGPPHFASSTVLREHRAGDKQKAADAFLMWNKATVDGVLKVVDGLTNRRKAERTLYLT
jgi:lysozyme